MEVRLRISAIENHIENLKKLLDKHLESNNIRKFKLVSDTIQEYRKELKKLEDEMTCEVRTKYHRNRNAIDH